MLKFTAVFEQVDSWWFAYVEELPGATTQGKTLEEARENLKEAVQLIDVYKRQIRAGRRQWADKMKRWLRINTDKTDLSESQIRPFRQKP